jgi:trk system potassium uptake protein TrkA
VSEKIPADAVAVGRALQDLPLPRTSVICAILRRGDVVIPRGNVVFEAGDEVLVLVDEAAVPKIVDLFGPPSD